MPQQPDPTIAHLVQDAQRADLALGDVAVVLTTAEIMRGRLMTEDAQRMYVLGPRVVGGTPRSAYLTIMSAASGTRFTFRVKPPGEDGDTCRRCQGTGLWQGRRGYPCRACDGTGAPIEGAPAMLFVSLLTGDDNSSDYTYLGLIRTQPQARYEHGAKSRVGRDAPGARAAEWFFSRLFGGASTSAAEVWHEGRCARCGLKLTVPSSVEHGFGPDCYERVMGGGA